MWDRPHFCVWVSATLPPECIGDLAAVIPRPVLQWQRPNVSFCYGVDMIFPRPLILIAVCICCGGPLLGQNPDTTFHWDGSKVETDNWVTIGQSTVLSAKERSGLIKAVALQLRPSMPGLGIESEQQLREFAARTWIKVVNLNGKGQQEVLARAADSSGFLCSPTGNCEVWIFRQLGDQYSVILKRGAVQNFTIEPTITHGFHDIVLGQHGSATEQGLTLFRFDGLRYQIAGCYEANWTILGKDGEVHDLDEPQITPCPTSKE